MIEFVEGPQGYPSQEEDRQAVQDLLFQELLRLQRYSRMACALSVRLFESAYSCQKLVGELENSILKNQELSSLRGGADEC